MALSRTIPTTQSTDLSTFTIKVEGEALPVDVQITSIVVIKEVNKIPVVRLKIIDGDPSSESFVISDGEILIPGKNIEIMMGYHSDDISVFKGIITKHSNKITGQKSELLIECRDKAVKMTISKKNKHYNDVTDSDVAEELLGNYGLDADVESSSIQHKDLVQFELTDWDFLLSRMDVIGKICLVNDGKVSFKAPDLSATPELDVLFGATILEYQAAMDARGQVKSLAAKSWDFSQQAITETSGAEPSLSQEEGNISATTIGDVLGVDDYKTKSFRQFGAGRIAGLGRCKTDEAAAFQNCRYSKIPGVSANVAGYVH